MVQKPITNSLCLRMITYGCILLGGVFAGPYACAQISSQDVYNNPDDHALNLAYAKQQILSGQMLDAGGALERMLFANPNWHSARLLYAAVLYRLDDQMAALRELSLLEGKNLNDEQKAKLESYKTAFQTPPTPISPRAASAISVDFDDSAPLRSSDRLQAQVSIQARADSNAGNALTDANFGFDNSGDVSVVLTGKVRAFTPVTDQISLQASAGALIRRHQTFEDVDYDVFDGSVGASVSDGAHLASLDVDARQINISGETYLQQIGPRLTFSHQLGPKTFNTISASVYNQNYDNISTTTLEEERDGTKVSFQTAILHKINDRLTTRLAAGYETKSARLDAFAFSGPVLAGSIRQNIADKAYVKASGKVRWINYEESLDEDFGDQNDTRIIARFAIGKKLGIGSSPSKPNAQQNTKAIEIGLNWSRRGSNFSNGSFENTGGDIRFIVGF